MQSVEWRGVGVGVGGRVSVGEGGICLRKNESSETWFNSNLRGLMWFYHPQPCRQKDREKREEGGKRSCAKKKSLFSRSILSLFFFLLPSYKSRTAQIINFPLGNLRGYSLNITIRSQEEWNRHRDSTTQYQYSPVNRLSFKHVEQLGALICSY